MEEKEYVRTICEILDSVEPILEHIKKCIFTEDRSCLEKAEKAQRAVLPSVGGRTGRQEGKKHARTKIPDYPALPSETRS